LLVHLCDATSPSLPKFQAFNPSRVNNSEIQEAFWQSWISLGVSRRVDSVWAGAGRGIDSNRLRKHSEHDREPSRQSNGFMGVETCEQIELEPERYFKTSTEIAKMNDSIVYWNVDY
jgi:hypothetical protein